MRRVAFKMKIKEGKIPEYIKRHQEVWPELLNLLKSTGISEYSIFLDNETHTLFGFQKVDGNNDSQDLASNPIVQKWWDFMSDVSETDEYNKPISIMLPEVFYMP